MPNGRGVPLICVDYASRGSGRRSVTRAPINRTLRIGLIAFTAAAWSGVLIWRLLSLQIYAPEYWKTSALKQHFSEMRLASERGPIYDRNGQLLAVSVPAGSVFVRPQQVKDKPAAARAVAEALGMPEAKVREQFSSAQPFVWIRRQIPKVHAERVAALNLEGVGYLVEPRRFYPYNHSGSALLGKVGIDGSGLSGLEAVYERQLSGEQFRARLIRDALGHTIESGENADEDFRLPKGTALRLTIDAAMQMILDEELEAGRVNARAKAALGVLIEADTGEVLALGQAPSLNPNEERVPSRQDMVNRVVETVFEPGSIMKPIVAASALDTRLIRAEEILDCENGRYPFGRHTIKDVHPYSLLSLHDVVVRSSNIGMTKVGMRMGRDRLYEALRRFGFGDSLGLALPGETKGILRSRDQWALVDVATHAFGQGVAVTAPHMVHAFAPIVNGGYLPKLRIVADGKDAAPVRVLSEESAAATREMLFAVVEDEHGTGHKAAIQGVRVGGKTGTAQKARKNGRGYASGLYMSSFVGFADASAIGLSEKLTLIVVIDEPGAGSIYGGAVAAPVFQRVMKRSLHLLGTRHRLVTKLDPAEQQAVPAAEEQEDGWLPVAYRP